ncbi:MAG: hypothetical protein LUG99_11460 [Lachnospiraceae bacterium]|nr:hypothetical protein [Lachnospiraceae bacterium]
MERFFQLSDIQFLFDAFRTAIGGVGWFVLAYMACILFFFIIGRKFLNVAFVYPLAFMAVTIFNPFLIVPIGELIGLTSRIRRIFWLLPVNLVLAFAFTSVCMIEPRKSYLSDPPAPTTHQRRLNRFRRCGAAALIVVFIAAAGTPVISNMHLLQNIYKVDNTLIAISSFLEEDSDETGLAKVVLYSDTALLELREYDPSIESALRRSDLLTYSPDITDETVIQETITSKQWLHVLALVSRFEVEVDTSAFRKAMKKRGANYIIMQCDAGMGDYYESAGYSLAAEIGVFNIYRKNVA